MAEKKHPGPGMPPPGPHGPGHAPKGGFRKPKNMRGTLRKLMRYLGRYKAHLALVVILLFISSACTVGGSYLIKPLINDYILPGDFPGLAKMLGIMAMVPRKFSEQEMTLAKLLFKASDTVSMSLV